MKFDLFSEPVKKASTKQQELSTEENTLKVVDATELAKESY